MQLIRTHDGLIGLKFNTKLIWCDNVPEATRIAATHFHEDVTPEQMARDIGYAIDHMARTGDTVAEFGVLGGFMYTTSEPDYEF